MHAIYVDLLCAIRFGLGWAHDIFFGMSHVHAFSYIRTFIYLYSYILMCLVIFCVSLFLLLSFFQLVISCHLNENPLRPRILFVLGHHLLILLLFTSGSMIRRPVRTSRKTSPNVAFIRNATLSYWTSPILLYWLSLIGGVGNLYVRCPWVVLSWSYRSSTPICMVLICLYLDRKSVV